MPDTRKKRLVNRVAVSVKNQEHRFHWQRERVLRARALPCLHVGFVLIFLRHISGDLITRWCDQGARRLSARMATDRTELSQNSPYLAAEGNVTYYHLFPSGAN